MPTMDQAVWSSVNVNVGGESKSFTRGDLLPEPGSADEVSERNLLRLGGALRTVEVVYTPEELAEQAKARAEASAAREAAADPGSEPGPPVLNEASGHPVVVAEEKQRGAGGKFTSGSGSGSSGSSAKKG